MQDLLQTTKRNDKAELRKMLDKFEREYAELHVALYELEQMRDRIATIAPILRQSFMWLDEVRRINETRWKSEQAGGAETTGQTSDLSKHGQSFYSDVNSSRVLSTSNDYRLDLSGYLYDGSLSRG
jgi:hypothetical protein